MGSNCVLLNGVRGGLSGKMLGYNIVMKGICK